MSARAHNHVPVNALTLPPGAGSLTETRRHAARGADSNTPAPADSPARSCGPSGAAPHRSARRLSAAERLARHAWPQRPCAAEREKSDERNSIEATSATAAGGSRLYREGHLVLRVAVRVGAGEHVVIGPGGHGSDGERAACLLRAAPASRCGTARHVIGRPRERGGAAQRDGRRREF